MSVSRFHACSYCLSIIKFNLIAKIWRADKLILIHVGHLLLPSTISDESIHTNQIYCTHTHIDDQLLGSYHFAHLLDIQHIYYVTASPRRKTKQINKEMLDFSFSSPASSALTHSDVVNRRDGIFSNALNASEQGCRPLSLHWICIYLASVLWQTSQTDIHYASKYYTLYIARADGCHLFVIPLTFCIASSHVI